MVKESRLLPSVSIRALFTFMDIVFRNFHKQVINKTVFVKLQDTSDFEEFL